MIQNPIWPVVVNKLHEVFDPVLDAHADINRATELKEWLFKHLALNQNTVHNENNLRVATSLAFEAVSGNMPAKLILDKVLNRIQKDGTYFISTGYPEAAHIQFHNATHFELEPNKIIDYSDYKTLHDFYGCNFSTSIHPIGGYSRCLSLPVFFNYLVIMDDNYKNKSLKLDDYLIDNDWDEDQFNIIVPFPKIPAKNNINMRGGKPLGWIAPTEKIEKIKQTADPPLELAQRLGISVKDSAKIDPLCYDILILINYDINFSQKVYQPASIHADWKGGGFVSYFENPERYGLTYNCYKSRGDSLQERVHIMFPVITDGVGAYSHNATIIGRVKNSVGLDFGKILEEALNRFKSLKF